MKLRKIVKLLLIPLTLIFLLFPACKNENAVQGGALKLNVESLVLYVGDDYVLRSTSNGTQWESEDSTIVQIDARGRLRALTSGETKVKASANGKTVECTVTVKEKQTFSTETVRFVNSQEVLSVNGTFTLSATVYVNGEETEEIPTYISDNETVATVVDGVVTAKAAGKAQIKATYGTATAICNVYVYDGNPSLLLNHASIEIAVNETVTLKPSLKESGALLESALVWETNNENVAVSESGEIKGVLPGETIVSVSVDGLVSYCHVKVVRVQEIDNVEAFLSIKDDPYLRYELKKDLDFSNYAWTDKTLVSKLSSTLDGKGKSLLHLKHETAGDRLGIFGKITETGAIKNLAVYIDELAYTDNSGALALYNYGTVQDCYVKVKAAAKTTSSVSLLRNGVVYENYGTMQNLVVDLDVTAQNVKTVTFHAFASKNFAVIKDCIVISPAVATRNVNTGSATVKNVYYQLLSGTSKVSHYEGYGYANTAVADNAQDTRRENCYIFESAQQLLTLGQGGYAIDGSKGMVPETEKASLQITAKNILDCYDASVWSFNDGQIVFFENVLYGA